jgi:LPS-assembly protein
MRRGKGRNRQGVGLRSSYGTVAGLAIAAALCVGASEAANAQGTLNDRLAATTQQSGNQDEHLVVEAREIVYDNDKNTVSAVGDVHLYYQGRVLEADRVTYDRNTRRVYAEGNARLTETDGTVATGERFELTDDFRDGFIDSLRIETTDKTRFSAPRAERTSGESTTFEKGTYTACEACKKDPSRPPLWQVKAAKIIHNNSEQMIYYEDASIEFWGVPLLYMPYFSTPDPTVKRKTGFLAPRFVTSSSLGYGASLPFFWNLAPNYDLTITPTILSRQGVLGQVEWRHRLMNGSYNIRAAGIFQQDKKAFLPPPLGAGDKTFRGSIETTGRFDINQQWKWGWDVALTTDKWFLQNYKIKSESITSTYFKESTSTVYLTGRSDTGFFDLRGYYFRSLSYEDWQKQQPVVHPVLDYNKRLPGPSFLGGEVTIDANVTSLTRDAAQYASVPDALSTPLFTTSGRGSIYYTCGTFTPADCIVRGVGGTTTRASVGLSWRRSFIDPLGQVWTPFAGLRVDAYALDINTTRYQNGEISNFLNPNENFLARAMPTVGLEYRYPLIAATNGLGTHTIEPIGQILVRPRETRIGELPNEDAQSLVFDDTNLFEWNKFSGYDRVEGGVRANVGLKYALTMDKGGYADVLFGQSYQLAGRNSYAAGDIAHVGLNSGLETKRSDYVGRIHIAPNSRLSFTGRGRFDERDFSLRRLELQANATLGPVTTRVMYARYAAQPELGYPTRREGLLTSARLKLSDNWSLNGSILLDLDRYLQDRQNSIANPQMPYAKSNPWTVAGLSLGAVYQDECTLFGITYSSSYKDAATGTKNRDQTLMFRLELRTIGEVSYQHQLENGTSLTDGVSSN